MFRRRHLGHHLLRTLTGVTLILVGTGVLGNLADTSPGLIGLGVVLMLGVFLTLTNHLLFVLLVIVLALTVHIGLGLILFPYALLRLVKFFLHSPKVQRTFGALPLKPITPDYESYLSCRAYLTRDATRSKAVSCVDAGGVFGTRWHYGPIWFEQYVGDTEPLLDPKGPLRVVIWQPLRASSVPRGWRETNFLEHIQLTGYTQLTNESSYADLWSSHARRQLKKWEAQKMWEIYTPTLDEFIAAYRKAPQGRLLKYLFIRTLRSTAKTQAPYLHLRGVRRTGKPGAPLESGFAFFDIPEAKQSKHFISFLLPSARKDPVSVGLMDDWFKHALRESIRILDFGVFSAEGDPESWRGFSRFKAQFDVHAVRYPLPRVRIIGSLKEQFRVY